MNNTANLNSGAMSTTESRGPRSILRSIGAVFAGILAIFVLSLGTDVVMHATGVFPPGFQPMSTPLWVLAMAYRIVYGIAGGYITARLAPHKPMGHALALGLVGIVLSTIGVASTWNGGPEYGPKWFSLALIAISVPCAWLGGKLRLRQLGQ